MLLISFGILQFIFYHKYVACRRQYLALLGNNDLSLAFLTASNNKHIFVFISLDKLSIKVKVVLYYPCEARLNLKSELKHFSFSILELK